MTHSRPGRPHTVFDATRTAARHLASIVVLVLSAIAVAQSSTSAPAKQKMPATSAPASAVTSRPSIPAFRPSIVDKPASRPVNTPIEKPVDKPAISTGANGGGLQISGQLPTSGPAGQVPQRKLSAKELGMMALRNYELKRYQEAYDQAMAALTLRPDQPEALLASGLLAIADHRDRDAISPLTSYIKTATGTTDHRGYEALGDINARSRAWSMADDLFSRAVSLAPRTDAANTRAKLLNKLAGAQAERNKLDDALKNATEAVNTARESADFQWTLARILARKPGKEKEATEARDQAIKLIRVELSALQAKFQADADSGPLLEKLNLLKDIFESQSRDLLKKSEKGLEGRAAIFRTLARSTAELADVERQIKLHTALVYAMEAVKYDSKNVDYLIDLALIRQMLDLRAAAVATAQRALEIDPKSTKAQNLLRLLRSGSVPTSGPSLLQ